MADTAAATVLGPHGAKQLPSVEVDSYNLELKDDEGFLGDRASRQAFHSILENWRKPLRKLGADPFGETPSDDLSRPKLDVILKEGDAGSRRRDPERDRGIRAGARGGDAALPQGQGLGRHRAHRDGRRLPREPHRRTRDRARQPHPQGRRHQGGHDADPQRSRRGRAARQPASCAGVDLQGPRQHPGDRHRRHQHSRRRGAAERRQGRRPHQGGGVEIREVAPRRREGEAHAREGGRRADRHARRT